MNILSLIQFDESEGVILCLLNNTLNNMHHISFKLCNGNNNNGLIYLY